MPNALEIRPLVGGPRRGLLPDEKGGLQSALHMLRFGSIMEKKGMTDSIITDQQSIMQECILQAATDGVPLYLPPELKQLRFDTGLTIDIAKQGLVHPGRCVFDFRNASAGTKALSMTSSITDTNAAPLHNIVESVRNIRFLGAAGVTNFYIGSESGKPYFANVDRFVSSGFETFVEYGPNSWGVTFRNGAVQQATGVTAPMIKVPTGIGTNQGERNNFENMIFYNSYKLVRCESSTVSLSMVNCSLDYIDIMAEILSGHLRIGYCHIETSKDTAILFTVGDGESAAILIGMSEIVLNNVNRTKEIFEVTDNIKFHGLTLRDTPISHNGGYTPLTYVKGSTRAVATGIGGHSAQPKPAFSRYMNYLRDGTNTAEAAAQWTLTTTGSNPAPVFNATAPNGAPMTGGCIHFPSGGTGGVSRAEYKLKLQPGQSPRFGCYLLKTDSAPATGQGKLQCVWTYFDEKNTIIGSSVTTYDADHTRDTWTIFRGMPTTPPPIGAAYACIWVQKSADSDGSAQFYMQHAVANAIQ